MGLRQTIRFKYDKPDLERILDDMGFELDKSRGIFVKQTDDMTFEAVIEDYGLYIDRSGEYLETLGLLVERLGEIATTVEIQDM